MNGKGTDKIQPGPSDENNVIPVDFGGGEHVSAEPEPVAEIQPDIPAEPRPRSRNHPAFGNSPHIAGIMPTEVQQNHPRPPQEPQAPASP